MEDNHSQNIRIGMHVEINPQTDRSRKILVKGEITEILTNARNHPHGILVRLKSGDVGRVKKICESIEKHERDISVTKYDESNKDESMSLGNIIGLGENHKIEFKAGALWSSKLTGDDIKNFRPHSKELHTYGQAASKVIISKTLAGLLNSDGGTLVIGVKENKNNSLDEIIGIELEFENLKDPCLDGYRRMLVDIIKDFFPTYIFNHFNEYLQISFEEIKGNTVCAIKAIRSDKRVFLKLKNNDHFFIRTDASTRELLGEEIIDYCEKRFKSN